MEFYAYPSHSFPSSSSASPESYSSLGSLVNKIKEFVRRAVSAVIGNVFSAIFTFFFALVGTLLGAMTGALIGQETESGFVRGASVGAISGAVFSIEVFESSLLLWQSDESGLGCLLYLIDVIASLLSGRLVRERIGPAMLSAVQSQVRCRSLLLDRNSDQFGLLTNVPPLIQMGAVEAPFEEEVPNIFDTGGAKGLLVDTVEKIPKFTITRDDSVDTSGDRVSCSVCLQDFQLGETVRRLPHCHHMFHLPCIDTWLVRHGSCPLCRRDL
ncbi:NEP1-interacting protein-like 1 isoform X1 [Sesamum indicum]|uniref:NEP1-interacting protein-like 1 isoform X1 n=1 Tax=Sesamum indicum TaxID=4182 RepID=A0A6I9T9L1_SESIN|nr:NEP1-interacting protein-like 1 isoform X1 [Sesamum indicum]